MKNGKYRRLIISLIAAGLILMFGIRETAMAADYITSADCEYGGSSPTIAHLGCRKCGGSGVNWDDAKFVDEHGGKYSGNNIIEGSGIETKVEIKGDYQYAYDYRCSNCGDTGYDCKKYSELIETRIYQKQNGEWVQIDTNPGTASPGDKVVPRRWCDKCGPVLYSKIGKDNCYTDASWAQKHLPPEPTKEPEYTLTVIAGKGGSVGGDNGVIEAGTEVTVTAKAGKGYKLKDKADDPLWTGDMTSNDASFTFIMPESDVTLTANFDKLPILTVIAGEGGKVSGDKGYIEPGETVKVTATANEGYELDIDNPLWTGDLTSKKATFSFTMPEHDVTLRANFKKIPKLTVIAEAGGTVSGDKGYIKAGTKVTVKAAANIGYKLGDPLWTGDKTSNNATFSFTMPEEDVTITANFELVDPTHIVTPTHTPTPTPTPAPTPTLGPPIENDMVTVIFDANGGTVSPESKEVSYNGSYGVLPTPKKTNNNFIGWEYHEQIAGEEEKIVAVDKDTRVQSKVDHVLTAKWSADPTNTPTPTPEPGLNYGNCKEGYYYDNRYFTTDQGYYMDAILRSDTYTFAGLEGGRAPSVSAGGLIKDDFLPSSLYSGTTNDDNNTYTRKAGTYSIGTDSIGNEWYFLPSGINATYVHPKTYKGVDCYSYHVSEVTELTFPDTVICDGTSYKVTGIGGNGDRYYYYRRKTDPDDYYYNYDMTYGKRRFEGATSSSTTEYEGYATYLYGVLGNGHIESDAGYFATYTSHYDWRLYESNYYVYNTTLKSVTIPDTVTTIHKGAFAYCQALEAVYGAKNVTTIEEWAFMAPAEDIVARISVETEYADTGEVKVTEKLNYWYNDAQSFSTKVPPMIEWEQTAPLSGHMATPEFNKIRYIKKEAFRYKFNLHDVRLGANTVNIEQSAFDGSNLDTITIKSKTAKVENFTDPTTTSAGTLGSKGKVVKKTLIRTVPDAEVLKYYLAWQDWYDIEVIMDVIYNPNGGYWLDTGSYKPLTTCATFTTEMPEFVYGTIMPFVRYQSSGSGNANFRYNSKGVFYGLDTNGNLWRYGTIFNEYNCTGLELVTTDVVEFTKAKYQTNPLQTSTSYSFNFHYVVKENGDIYVLLGAVDSNWSYHREKELLLLGNKSDAGCTYNTSASYIYEYNKNGYWQHYTLSRSNTTGDINATYEAKASAYERPPRYSEGFNDKCIQYSNGNVYVQNGAIKSKAMTGVKAKVLPEVRFRSSVINSTGGTIKNATLYTLPVLTQQSDGSLYINFVYTDKSSTQFPSEATQVGSITGHYSFKVSDNLSINNIIALQKNSSVTKGISSYTFHGRTTASNGAQYGEPFTYSGTLMSMSDHLLLYYKENGKYKMMDVSMDDFTVSFENPEQSAGYNPNTNSYHFNYPAYINITMEETVTVTETELTDWNSIGIKKIYTAGNGFLILGTDGKLYANGRNKSCMLGTPDGASTEASELVMVFDKAPIKDIIIGDSYTIIRTTEDEYYVAGYKGSHFIPGDGYPTSTQTTFTKWEQTYPGLLLTNTQELYDAGYMVYDYPDYASKTCLQSKSTRKPIWQSWDVFTAQYLFRCKDGSEIARRGHEFFEWNSMWSGAGTVYEAGKVYKITELLTLYARWSEIPRIIRYERNGGTGTMEDTVLEEEDTGVNLSKNMFTLDGYKFTGWIRKNEYTEGKFEGDTYADEAEITDVDGLVVMYAQWEPITYTLQYAAADIGVPYTLDTKRTLKLLDEHTVKAALADKTVTVSYNLNKGSGTTNPVWVTTDNTATKYRTSTQTFTGWRVYRKLKNKNTGTSEDFEFLNEWYKAGTKVSALGQGENDQIVMFPFWGGAYSRITLPVAERVGYTFYGWSTSSTEKDLSKIINMDTESTEEVTYLPKKSETLYAVWQPERKTIALEAPDADVHLQTAVTVTFDETVPDLTELPARDKYKFRGYYTEPDGKGVQVYNQDGKGLVTWNTVSNLWSVDTLYAYWVPKSLTSAKIGIFSIDPTYVVEANLKEELELPTFEWREFGDTMLEISVETQGYFDYAVLKAPWEAEERVFYWEDGLSEESTETWEKDENIVFWRSQYEDPEELENVRRYPGFHDQTYTITIDFYVEDEVVKEYKLGLWMVCWDTWGAFIHPSRTEGHWDLNGDGKWDLYPFYHGNE